MAGNTGNMTTEEISARGPRLRLLRIKSNAKVLGCVISREGEIVVHPHASLKVAYLHIGRYATSYSLGYLLRVARVGMELR